MEKIKNHGSYGDGVTLYTFWCPACNKTHPYHVGEGGWEFNNNMDFPSFTPSLRVLGLEHDVNATQCHLYVTNGNIRYCTDCPHKYAGQTISMINMEDNTSEMSTL